MLTRVSHYFSFHRKTARAEYWIIYILNLIAGIAAERFLSGSKETVFLLVFAILCVIFGWLMLATTARRCRDAGLSLWFLLLLIVPVVGVIFSITIGFLKSKAH